MRESSPESRVIVGVIALSLFVDYFLYGVVMPLTAHSPAGITTERQLGFLYGGYAVSVLLVTPLCGYFGDRIGLRTTILCGSVLLACATALFALGASFFVIFAARLLQGAASAALWTGGLALIAERYVHNRVEMIGYAFTGSTAGSVLGPVLGGALYHVGGYRLPFAVTGVLAAIEIALLLLFVRSPRKRRRVGIHLGSLLTNKSIAMSALAVALAAFAWGVIEPLLPLRLSRFGAKPEALGLMFTASSIIYGLCAPLVAWICGKAPVRRVILLGTIAMAVTLPLLAVFRGIFLIGAALCLINCTFAFMLNPASAELGNEVDRSGLSSYSAVYAIYNIVYSIGMMATTALTSAGTHLLGFLGILLCVSATLFICSPFLMLADSPRAAEVQQSSGQ